MDLIESS